MCLFGVSVRKANAEISAELDGCTSDCAILLATAWRTKRGDIMSERYLSMRVPTSPSSSDVQIKRESTMFEK